MDDILSRYEPKKNAARSQAISTGSMFSQMKGGLFFKMVESPFKMQMMNAYEKLQDKMNG